MCPFVVERLQEVYRVDAQAKEQKLSDAARLALHEEQSRPVMDKLRAWMNEQFEQRNVEPNCGLGQALTYMLKRWGPPTRFLEVPGAPLDNNPEQALKMAILHRKNSGCIAESVGQNGTSQGQAGEFVTRGDRVGDAFMSLIHTCQLNRLNPFEYLLALQKHSQDAAKDPTRWLPWHYTQVLAPASPLSILS